MTVNMEIVARTETETNTYLSRNKKRVESSSSKEGRDGGEKIIATKEGSGKQIMYLEGPNEAG